jgi:transposase
MNRAKVLQEVRLMKFEDIYSRRQARQLTQEQAAEILGVSARTLRRWEDRYEAEGAEGLFDRRLGKQANNRVPADTTMEVLELFDTQYWDYTPKHFHEKLEADHSFKHSYNWLRLTLQRHGRIQHASRRGAHRRKRERRPMVGMMLHQDGSSHEWVPDQWWDLIVTMDDANSEIYSAFFVPEEGTMSSFLGIKDVIETHGLFCSLYTDRGSHYWHTPEAGGKVDKQNLTQVGRAMQQLGIEMIPAYSPEARGRSERMFGTLQNRLPQELRSQGITTMDSANRYLKEVFVPAHNARFEKSPADGALAFVSFAGNIRDTLCIQEDRTVGNDNTVRYKNLVLQIAADQHRHHFVKAKVRVHEYPEGNLALFHGPRCIGKYAADGTPIEDTKDKQNVA